MRASPEWLRLHEDDVWDGFILVFDEALDTMDVDKIKLFPTMNNIQTGGVK